MMSAEEKTSMDQVGHVTVNYSLHIKSRFAWLIFVGGAYGVFAGHDATRGLATWIADETQVKDVYDPCSDLTEVQWMQVRDWEDHFMTKYDYVGKLLTPEEVANRKTDGPSLDERKELFEKVQALVKEADELAVKELEKEEQPKDEKDKTE